MFWKSWNASKQAAEWINENANLFKGDVLVPSILRDSREVVDAYVEDIDNAGFSYDDIRDNFLFDFENTDDCICFDTVRRSNMWFTHLSINGKEYLSNTLMR